MLFKNFQTHMIRIYNEWGKQGMIKLHHSQQTFLSYPSISRRYWIVVHNFRSISHLSEILHYRKHFPSWCAGSPKIVYCVAVSRPQYPQKLAGFDSFMLLRQLKAPPLNPVPAQLIMKLHHFRSISNLFRVPSNKQHIHNLRHSFLPPSDDKRACLSNNDILDIVTNLRNAQDHHLKFISWNMSGRPM